MHELFSIGHSRHRSFAFLHHNHENLETHQLGQTVLDGKRASFFTAASAADDAVILTDCGS